MKRNKKLTLLILLALMMVLCLCLFTACQNEKWDLNEHPNTPPELDLVGKGVELLYKWIGSYGWTVVVFTVLLKLIMTPLDFWQRFSAKKQAVKTQEMQPIIESIDKRYGANSQKGNEEKQKLYKKQGVSMFSTCLPLIASMVIFFVMWGGLNSYSSRINVQNYLDLHDAYVTEYDRVASEHKGEPIEDYNQEAITKAKDAVVKRYNTDVQQGWLWIKNVWRPDTWEKVMLDYTAFTNGSMGTVGVILDSKDGEAIYKNIYDAVISDYDGW
ncbi:MAG: YidC/Oxa1 family membrane protein insertase, partial [Clostridia bacterium]